MKEEAPLTFVFYSSLLFLFQYLHTAKILTASLKALFSFMVQKGIGSCAYER